jgi:hypothetical protein
MAGPGWQSCKEKREASQQLKRRKEEERTNRRIRRHLRNRHLNAPIALHTVRIRQFDRPHPHGHAVRHKTPSIYENGEIRVEVGGGDGGLGEGEGPIGSAVGEGGGETGRLRARGVVVCERGWVSEV